MKGHSRNISVKLFQNLTSGFRKVDSLRISSCTYSWSSPLQDFPWPPCFFEFSGLWPPIFFFFFFLNDPQNLWFITFFNSYEGGHCDPHQQKFEGNPCPFYQSHVNWWIEISQTMFKKGHPRNIPEKFFKIRPVVSEKKNFLMSV